MRTYCLVIFLITVCSANFLREGEECYTKRGPQVKGICKRKVDCKVGKITRYDNEYRALQACGFDRGIQLFCCPPTVDRVQAACAEYKKNGIPKIASLISGGRPAKRGEFPHMVALWYDDERSVTPWQCAGTLISDLFVLTAAHCLTSLKPSKLRVGDTDLVNSNDDGSAAEYGIAEIIVHPRFNEFKSIYNDIGLVKANSSITFGYYVYPACIETSSSHGALILTISGWGSTSGNNLKWLVSEHKQPLRYATVNVVENSQCNLKIPQGFVERYYPKGIISSLVCAVPQSNKRSNTCTGDSGGPLQYVYDDVYFITGITAFGPTCGNNDEFGLYTRVSSFAPWIEVFVWKTEKVRLI